MAWPKRIKDLCFIDLVVLPHVLIYRYALYCPPFTPFTLYTQAYSIHFYSLKSRLTRAEVKHAEGNYRNQRSLFTAVTTGKLLLRLRNILLCPRMSIGMRQTPRACSRIYPWSVSQLPVVVTLAHLGLLLEDGYSRCNREEGSSLLQ